VLALAMPTGDDYPLGEERRLFYVALTRARRSVVMFTARGQCSHFLRELEADGAVAITDTDGKAVREEGCPSCKQGVLILRSGPYGKFRSCSNFPACSYKPKNSGKGQSISTNCEVEQPTSWPTSSRQPSRSPRAAQRSSGFEETDG
jgi:DNA helicase IV